MRIAHIIGARPNFMKAAPVVRALNQVENVIQVLIHSGQHYDTNMSEVFFQQLELPKPDINLGVGSGSHAMQTAQVMIRLEEFFQQRPSRLGFSLWRHQFHGGSGVGLCENADSYWSCGSRIALF